MRVPRYLSPTSIDLFYKDRTEFYLRYLAEHRPPRIPQTRPMAAGAAFDAYIKSYLVGNLYGRNDEQFQLDNILETQVEKQNLDWGIENGKYLFACYKKTGALADLMIELEKAVDDPRFEFTVEGRVTHEVEIGDIPLLGKPDVYFKTKDGVSVIFDWKVNGYCSKNPTSPKKGYLKVRGLDGSSKMHKDCHMMDVKGITINIAEYLENIDEGWARQLSIYGWLLGEKVGSMFVIGIEQLVAKPTTDKPLIRVASHRSRTSKEYQDKLFNRVAYVWSRLKDGDTRRVFTDLNEEESHHRCLLLDEYYKAYDGDGSFNDEWFQQITRQHKEF